MRRRKSRKLPIVIVILSVAGLVAGVYALSSFQSSPPGTSGSFPYPCNVETNGLAIHIHPWLKIVVNGQNVTIPADIGMTNGCEEPTHTHDASGIIHLESPDATGQYTLGGFFQVWSATYGSVAFDGTQHPIVFNSTDILGFKADATHNVVLLVDGKPSSEWGALNLDQLDYCSASTTGPPCYPTVSGNPYWNGSPYPYGVGHTIVIEYVTVQP